MVTLLLKYAARPAWQVLLALLAAVLCGLGLSLTAVFLLFALIACLGLALALQPARMRTRVQILAAAAFAALPLVVAGLLLQVVMRGEVGVSVRPIGMDTWRPIFLSYVGRGTAELLWFLTLPLLALLVRSAGSRAYLLLFPLLLAVSFANPLLFRLVAGSLTSYHTYYRVLWLLPVAPALGVLLALLCRLLAAVLLLGDPARMPLRLALLFGLVSMALPGIFVFGPANSFIGVLGKPHLADNIEKMPTGLVPIAARLAADPEIGDVRILANEQITAYLTPYSRAFRHVQTRALYTPTLFALGGRVREGVERSLLASVLFRGDIPAQPSEGDWQDIKNIFGTEAAQTYFGEEMKQATRSLDTLLSRYRVRYVILGPGDLGAEVLHRAGFQPIETQGPFSLLRASPGSGR